MAQEGQMELKMRLLVATCAIAGVACTPAYSYEFGSPGFEQKPGIAINASAGVPPPGVYMFNQAFTYQTNLVGPGNALLNPTGGTTGVQVSAAAAGFLWVPGWMFLGATYDAVLVQPVVMESVGSPVNFQASGVHNTYIVPAELSWKLGDSGFFVK